jgi:hypothetical protein
MEGSFMVRLRMLLPQNPFYNEALLDADNDYEWYGYSFEDFAAKWDPGKF